MTTFSAFRRLDRNVRLLLFAAGLTGMTVLGGIFGVLFNLFILRLGYGTEFIGLVNATGLLAFAAPSLLAGWLGSRWGTRPTLILGLAITAVGYGLLSLTDLLPTTVRDVWLLTTNIVGSAGSAIYIVNTGPFLAEMTKPDERAHALSAQVAVWPLAGFIGSLLGGTMPGLFAQLLVLVPTDPAVYRYTMLVASLLVLPSIYALLQTRVVAPDRVDKALAASPAPTRFIILVALTVALQVSAEGVAMIFFNVYLDRALNVPVAQIGLLLALARLGSVPAALATPMLIERWGTRRTYIISSTGIAIAVLPLALIPHWLAAEIGFLGVVAMASIGRSAMSTYQMGLVPARWRSMMSATATTGVGLSFSALSLAGGYAIGSVGYPTLFLTSAACTLAGVLVYMLFVRSPLTV
jgi:MFS family permease